MNCPNCNSKLNNEKNPYCMRCGYQNSESMIKGINTTGLGIKKSIHNFFNKYSLILIIFFLVTLVGYGFIKTEFKKRETILTCNEILAINDKNTFANQLYISDERVYNYLLKDFEKDFYRNLFKTITNYEESIIFDLTDKNFKNNYQRKESVEKVIDAILMDHPELIQINDFEYNCDYDEVLIKISYHFNKEDQPKMLILFENRLNSIVNDLEGLNDYDKSLRVYQMIGLNNSLGDNTSSYSVVDPNLKPNNRAIASASQIIFQSLGIDSIIIKEKIDDKYIYRNMIRLDNDFYNFDASKYFSEEDPTLNKISYSGFLYKNYFGKIKYSKITPIYVGNKFKFKKD